MNRAKCSSVLVSTNGSFWQIDLLPFCFDISQLNPNLPSFLSWCHSCENGYQALSRFSMLQAEQGLVTRQDLSHPTLENFAMCVVLNSIVHSGDSYKTENANNGKVKSRDTRATSCEVGMRERLANLFIPYCTKQAPTLYFGCFCGLGYCSSPCNHPLCN